MNRTNIDRILIVRSDNSNKLILEGIQIPAQDALFDVFSRMYEDDDSTLMGIQMSFNEWLEKQPKDSRKDTFKFCIPHEYSEAFISAVTQPRQYTRDEYKKLCDEMMADCVKAAAEKNIPHNTPDRKRAIADKARFYYKNRMKEKKSELISNCKRYILSLNYFNAAREIAKDPSVRMYSSEMIGWTTFEHKVSDDFVIKMKTNFCYGRVAYLKLWVRYKGVDILPYSSLVNYYKANMADIIRYTRSYSPVRDNWESAMTFTVKAGNLSKDDPDAFIQEYVLNEVEKMLTGLKEIASKPTQVIDRMKRNPNESATQYRSVRNINNEESGDYLAYPNEMALAFKAEKITGALYFLDNLQQLSEIKVAVDKFISRIKDINMAFLPELKDGIRGIKTDVETLKSTLEAETRILVPLERKYKEYLSIYHAYVEEFRRKNLTNYSTQDKYLSSRFETYAKDKESYEKQRDVINHLNFDITKREKFLENLDKCEKMISDIRPSRPETE